MKRLHLILTVIGALAAAGSACAQTISADQTSLAFTALVGGSPVPQTVNVASTGGSTSFLVFTNASWLTAVATGTTPAALTVTADPTVVKAGVYTTNLLIVGPNTVTIPVTFSVGAIGVSPTSVQFTYQTGGTFPPAQPVLLSGQATTFTAAVSTTSGGSWLAVIPTSGNSPGTLSVLLNPSVFPNLSPGTYSGTVVLTPTSGGNSVTATVAVTLTVTPVPPVTVNPASLAYNIQIGGANNTTQQTLTIANGGAQALTFSANTSNDASAGKMWLSASPGSGTIAANSGAQTTVAVDSSNLSAGTYSGKVTVSTPNGSPASQDIPVSLLVSNNPLLSVPGSTLNFVYQFGGAAPAPQNVTATSTNVALSSTTGQMPLAISAATSNNSGNWLTVPVAGVTGTPFAVSINPSGLAPGSYSGTITVQGAGAGNGPQQIPVVLKVSVDPLLVSSVAALTFVYQIGQTTPSSQNIVLTSSTGAPLNFTATAATLNGKLWLLLNGSGSGTTDATQAVTVDPSSLSVGTYKGTITISAINPATGASALNSPLTVQVTLYVSAGALLAVNPSTPLLFQTQQNSTAILSQTVTLSSTSPTDALTYTVGPISGANWLGVIGPQNGSTAAGSNTLNVVVSSSSLPAGTYTANITVTALGPGASAVADSPYTIPVTLQVTAGTLMLDKNSLAFTQTAGGAAPAAQTVAVSTSAQSLVFTTGASSGSAATWLFVTPASGSTPGTISISADGSKLAAGVYTGTVSVAAVGPNNSPVGGSPAKVTVTLTVNAGAISVAPTSLAFTQVVGGTAPAPLTLAVSSAPAAVNFAVSASADNNGTWLSATPANGSTPASVKVSASAGNLALGIYKGTVTIAAPGATGSPLSVPVTLTVVAAQTLTAAPSNLTFNYAIGQPAPQPQTVQVGSSGTNVAFTVAASGGSWLQVTPTGGNTPGTLTVSVNTQGLAAGKYNGSLTVSSSSALTTAIVSVSLTVASIPTPLVGGIANAGSYATGAISAGENIVLFGTGIGPDTLTFGQATSTGALDTIAGGLRVLFDGIAAPVYYASAGQTSAFVPYDIAGRVTTNVVVEYQGVQSAPIAYSVLAAVPGIYTLNRQGTGPGAIVNQNYTINGTSAPAPKGSVVSVYMTGEGQTSPPGQNGVITPVDGSVLKRPLGVVTASVANLPATVTYAGSAPGSPNGVMQVNVQIPANTPSGAAAIVITVGTASTQGSVTVTVQ